jgi:Dynein heavy chain C-terminal domain
MIKQCQQEWLQNGPPQVFWLPGFFMPHSFLSVLLANCTTDSYDNLDNETIMIDSEVFNFMKLKFKKN